MVIQPQNNANLVDDYMNRISFPPCTPANSHVTIKKLNSTVNCAVPDDTPPVTFKDILTHFVDLQSIPTQRTLRVMAEQCDAVEDKNRLMRYAEKEVYLSEIVKCPRSMLDLFRECPSLHLFPERFFSLVPRLHPRYYSISSSNLVSRCTLSSLCFKCNMLLMIPPIDMNEISFII